MAKMEIYLSPNTATRGGGALNGNLRHLPTLIQTELVKSGFTSSFEQLWLTLSYPPMFMLRGVVGMKKGFEEYYDKLPYSRLYRRYKKIDVSIQAPEFSEHFDKSEQNKYQHTFDVEDQYKNLTELKLAAILIDKYLEVAEIIQKKIKKEDKFDFEKFRSVLMHVKLSITDDFLKENNEDQAIKLGKYAIQQAIEIREDRKNTERQKNRIIRDLRVYHDSLPVKALYPYDYQYSEIFLNLLRRNKLMCPDYDHLYIRVCETFDAGLTRSLSFENWYVNGISVIDYPTYLQASEKQKEEIVFDVISKGLEDIVRIDNLELSILEHVMNEIKLKGLDTELLFDTVENDKYHLKITYFSRSWEDECPIYFQLTDTKTNDSRKVMIGRADISQIYFWLQTIKLMKDKVVVKSSNSSAAGVWLKDKPRGMEFTYTDIFAKEADATLL